MRILLRISELEKYQELKQSALLLFLSHFEGYEYPPVEALYCNTPCIAYDLPVLHEVGGPGIQFVRPGDTAQLRSTMARVLTEPAQSNLRSIVEPIVSFENYAAALGNILEPVAMSGPRASARTVADWRRMECLLSAADRRKKIDRWLRLKLKRLKMLLNRRGR